MYSALTVADEILKEAKRNSKALTPMQLVKLTYIAHGWALAILNKDLFQDRIEAWKYGPVIPSLYQATKQFGRGEIPLHLINEDAPSKLDVDDLEFIQEIVSKYGGMSGFQLSDLTHQRGTPWEKVYVDGRMNIEITDDLIRQHYKERLFSHDKQSASPAECL